jgi:hypothetical protein
MHARLQGERGPAMTQVVQPDLRQPKAAHGVGESAGESFRVQHRPVDVAKQEVVSVQPAPISSRSAACRLRCSRSPATVAASRVTVRRPFAVFCAPSIGVCLDGDHGLPDRRPAASRSRSDQRRPSASPRRVTAVAVLRSDDEFAGETLGPTCCAQVGPHRQRARHFLVAGSIS